MSAPAVITSPALVSIKVFRWNKNKIEKNKTE